MDLLFVLLGHGLWLGLCLWWHRRQARRHTAEADAYTRRIAALVAQEAAHRITTRQLTDKIARYERKEAARHHRGRNRAPWERQNNGHP